MLLNAHSAKLDVKDAIKCKKPEAQNLETLRKQLIYNIVLHQSFLSSKGRNI